MCELQKFKLGIKNTFDQYLNCAPLNERVDKPDFINEGENDYKKI